MCYSPDTKLTSIFFANKHLVVYNVKINTKNNLADAFKNKIKFKKL